jgi:hypothetical protein
MAFTLQVVFIRKGWPADFEDSSIPELSLQYEVRRYEAISLQAT